MTDRDSKSTTPRADAQRDDARPPNAFLVMLEGRAPMEFLSLFAALPWLYGLPRGDGHPVMVFPGMGASDLTTVPLRRYLQSLGYVTQAWGQGLNFGPRPGVIERAAEDLRSLADRHGQPVSLIGWSLGGIYARELAKMHPAESRCVVTLGTPFTGHPKATNVWRIYELLSRSKIGDASVMAQIRLPPLVPTTSIFSRSDGVVSWRCSINDPGPLVENIEVPASHIGMGANPFVLYAVADRLAQPTDHWRPFDIRGARRLFFRTALPDASAPPA
ncbi:MAG TPA: alpha/beta hydrolase [Caldimonas sp.]|nr:alpha/beta hydrolase [Caldimonas sp.]HEX4235788.1 alpha/beta hydrolase [Caldimonas sp.]